MAGILAAGLAPAVHAQAAIRWRMVSSFPRSLDTIYSGAELFAKTLRALSGGRFDVSVHAGGELMPPLGVLDAVRSGSIDIAHTASHLFYGEHPVFALGSMIPFGPDARQMAAWMQYGNGRRLMNAFYAGYGVLSLAAGNTGAWMGGWFRREIRRTADFKGLRMRFGSALNAEVMRRLGAVASNVADADICQSLEKGAIDAAEWFGPDDGNKLGLPKAAAFCYAPAWAAGGAEIDLLINQKALAALSPESRAMLEAAAAQVGADTQARYDTLNPAAFGQIAASRTRLRSFAPTTLNAVQQVAQAVYAENDAKEPEWKKIRQDLEGFRRSQAPWLRMAEPRNSAFGPSAATAYSA
jgi:TRAP-type mannitol/chloroaromatic compound transport system substrate-binding protein